MSRSLSALPFSQRQSIILKCHTMYLTRMNTSTEYCIYRGRSQYLGNDQLPDTSGSISNQPSQHRSWHISVNHTSRPATFYCHINNIPASLIGRMWNITLSFHNVWCFNRITDGLPQERWHPTSCCNIVKTLHSQITTSPSDNDFSLRWRPPWS